MMKRGITGITSTVRAAANSLTRATASKAAAAEPARGLAGQPHRSVLGRPPAQRDTRVPTAEVPKRGIVTQATQQILDQMPSTGAVAEHIRFQAYGCCEFNMAALSDGRVDRVLKVKTNPSADDIQHAVHNHGPVRLILQGLLPKKQGGAEYTRFHAALVTAVVVDTALRRRVAVLADGNDRATA